ncbi:MAG: hypothetical protein K2W82_08130 [Candidatus Obscuribacterales bacterium]|nr:hypothetical protein [Candidatus Obscuribacterales bacterium]
MVNPKELTPARLQILRAEAQEYRRRLMQGLGRPIISYEQNGKRYVQVGNELKSSNSWRTFHDFLLDYIKLLFSSEWGTTELKKSDANAHPLIIWYRKVCEFQRNAAPNKTTGLYNAHQIGAVRAYLGLAYDLYLCAHNAKLQEKLLQRLRNKDQFEGAVHEAFVVGCFVKAGYRVDFEDEQDSTRSHCEFTATHLLTGRKFSVEAKAIKSTSNRAGASNNPPRIGDKLSGALQKKADHERIIFIDLSRAENFSGDTPPNWVKQVESDIATDETSWTFDGQPAPPAYLFVTNSGFLHALDSTQWSELRFMTGFKIPDFPVGRNPSRIIDFVRAREKHLEVIWLHEALDAHKSIPATFDSRTAEEVFDSELLNRPRIGDNIGIVNPDGETEVFRLLDAQVDLSKGEVFAQLQREDGSHTVGTFMLTPAEIAAYKREPNSFFDIVKPVRGELQTPLDCYDFLFETYQHSTRETLLRFMDNLPHRNACQDLPQHELAEIYCEQMAIQMWTDSLQRGVRKNAGR